MYKSIKIHNFRGFKDFVMDDVKRINLVAGVNNVGKTALLEAIFLHCGAYNPGLILNIDKFRGVGQVNKEFKGGRSDKSPWDSLFYNFDDSRKIEIEGVFEDGFFRKIDLYVFRHSEDSFEKGPIIRYRTSAPVNPPLDIENTVVLSLDYEEIPSKNAKKRSGSSFLIIGPDGISTPIIKPPPFSATFLPASHRIPLEVDAKRFGSLEIVGKQDLLLDFLRLIEPKLKRIAVVATSGLPVLYGDIGLGKMLQLAYMGDGMARLTSIILAISYCKDGVLLIDEIENGFHHTMMQNVWHAIGTAARDFNTQIFATTHSLECILSAHKAFVSSEPYDLLVHRLNRVDGSIKDITFGHDDLDTALELKMDVR